jgi:hypothetical protein
MFFYIYKITNLVNNRVYIGVHKTKNFDDGYMGSGKIIRQAIEKYGLSNFKKEILETFNDYETALKRESEIVNEQFVSDSNTYNLKLGGSGGFDYITKNKLNLTPEVLKKRGESIKETFKKNPRKVATFDGKNHSEKTKKVISEKRKMFFENGGEHPKGMLNKQHKEETKKQVSNILKIKGSMIGKKGLEHPSGGTKWYNDGLKHLRSDKHPGEGWIEGRIFKKRKRNI